MRPHGDADPAHLGAAALTRAGGARLPVEELGTAIERLLHERAGHVATLPVRRGRAEAGLALGRVEAPDGDLVEPELPGGLGHDRLDDAVGLHRSGDRCCERGGVLVSTLTARHRIAPG